MSNHTGHDSHGNLVTLGGVDTDGQPVGYIDAEGLAWESRAERDAAVGAGRLLEAMREQPIGLDVIGVLDTGDVLPEHRQGALVEAIEQHAMMGLLRASA